MIFSIDEAERQGGTALIEAESQQSWTYEQLREQVEKCRDVLQNGNRGLLFLFCKNQLSAAAWYLGALEADVPLLLLGSDLNTDLRARLLAQYTPEWIVSEAMPPAPGYEPGNAPQLWKLSYRSESESHPDLSVLLSTSGSTGSPKLVRLTKKNILANARSICEGLRIEADHFPVAHLPLHYSYGLSVLNSHLLAGARVMLTNDGLMNSGFWQAIRDHQVNSFSGVPYTYQMLRRLDLNRLNVPSLRTFTQAGGKLDDTNVAYFHELVSRRGGTFWVMYGQTEATARIAILPAEELPRKLGTAGKSVPGGRFSIKTDTGEISSSGGATGELIYEGPNVMMGYAESRDDLARGDELQGRLETGDRASLDDEGYVRILGRSKRDAKIFGLRVNLDDLEGLVKRNGAAAAISAGDKGVVIFCEFGNDETLQAIRTELATTLQIHSSALHFRRIDQLPVKTSGKIDYDRLQSLL